MPATWRGVSKEIAGRVLPQTVINEEYVATKKVQKLLNEGKSAHQIALIWNGTLGGSEKPIIKKGRNRFGVAFNTAAYAEEVVSNIND